MEVWRAFQILELSRNTDKKEIKKAYAKKAGQCHPEEHPEEWKRLHDAYKTALSYAKDRDTDMEDFSVQKNFESFLYTNNRDKEASRGEENINHLQNTTEKPYGDLFSKIDELAEEKRKEYADLLKLQLQEMKETKKFLETGNWKKLFESEAFTALQKEEWVVKAVKDLIMNQQYRFSTLTFVYETMIQWKETLQEDGKSELTALVQETVDFLRFKWNLTEKNLKQMRKTQNNLLLAMWKNVWYMSLRHRILLFAVISMVLMLVDGKRGFIVGAMCLLVAFIKFLSLRVLNPEKRPVGIKNFIKKVSFEHKLFMLMGCLIAMGGIFLAADELFPEIYRVEIHSYRDILHARKSKQLEEDIPDFHTYIFYLINEGIEGESVLVIPSEKQSEFEKILVMGSTLEYNGDYRNTYSFELEADFQYYYYNHDISEWSDEYAQDFMLGTTPVQEARQWLAQPVCWVTDFKTGT